MASVFRRVAGWAIRRLGRAMARWLIRPVAAADNPAIARQMLSSDTVDVATPEIMSLAVLPAARHLRRPVYRPPVPSVMWVRDAVFVGAAQIVLDERRRLILESLSTAPDIEPATLRGVFGGRLHPLDGPCSTFRSARNGHYHTLIDNLPRLYVLHLAQHSLPAGLQLLHAGPLSPVEAFCAPRLMPVNAGLREVRPDVSYRVATFVLPSFLTRRFAGWLPGDYLEWFRDRLGVRPRGAEALRIVIRRGGAGARQRRLIENEDEVMRCLEPMGFQPHVLESMTPAAQVELFRKAEIVVGAHGAGLANMIFATNAAILELAPGDQLVPHYYFLARACGHRHVQVGGMAKGRNPNFRVDLERLMAGLKTLQA